MWWMLLGWSRTPHPGLGDLQQEAGTWRAACVSRMVHLITFSWLPRAQEDSDQSEKDSAPQQ
jgi:hypothetical protein